MFSKAEQLVIDHLKNGLSNNQIADLICVSEQTVKYHLTNIYKKANASSRTDFVLKYKQQYEGMKMNSNDTLPNNKGYVAPVQRPTQPMVNQKTQEDKITFINDKFNVAGTITHLHSMMKDVTSKEITPATVNAACNCVSRLNETINTAIAAARFLSER